MTLRCGAQLEEVHRLAGVELHHEPDAVGHGDGIRRLLRKVGLEGVEE